MFDTIMTYLSIIGIYLGIPAAAFVVYWGISGYILRDSKMSDCCGKVKP